MKRHSYLEERLGALSEAPPKVVALVALNRAKPRPSNVLGIATRVSLTQAGLLEEARCVRGAKPDGVWYFIDLAWMKLKV